MGTGLRAVLLGVVVAGFGPERAVAGGEGADDGPSGRPQLAIGGGVSAGWFRASHAGEDGSGSQPLLSNVLVELGSADETVPVSLQAALGQTSTPSLLDPPAANRELGIEFASVLVRPRPNAEVAVGLLTATSGYEDDYTYNNANIVGGLLSAAQPYNAYGARARLVQAGLELSAGYYPTRLDETEYGVFLEAGGEAFRPAGRSWELEVGLQKTGVSYRAYHYHLNGLRSLTGAVCEAAAGPVVLAANLDYWRWDASMSGYYGRRHALGAAAYAALVANGISVPMRLELVDQGSSRIYVDEAAAERLWSATVTPTYRWSEWAYARAEASFVHARDAFLDTRGRPKGDRVYAAMELGCTF